MRLIKVNAPEGLGSRIAETAFSAGIESVSLHRLTHHTIGASPEQREVIDIETSTPKARKFIYDLLRSGYYDPGKISFNTRQPRAIISSDDVREITHPLSEPSPDLYQELWQFSHVTYGLILRILVSAGLIAYGLIDGKILLIIGGLLFLPVLPMAMAVSFGLTGREFRLAGQGIRGIAAAAGTLYIGAVVVAALCDPPIRFDDLGTFWTGIIISIAIGIAAQLAAVDDAGRRELIGLAAASQLGLIPVWLGILTVFGLSASDDKTEVITRIASFLANLFVLIAAMAATKTLITRNDELTMIRKQE